jgi:N-acetylglutamate synthase-like GNAT family acetyltransferase
MTAPEEVRSVDRLRDGTPVRIRRARPDDRAGVADFLRRLSRDSLELRFFSAVQSEVVASQILDPHPLEDHVSLLMESVTPLPGRIIAHAELARFPQHRREAEVAFLVVDDCQGLGAATLLLEELVREARHRKIAVLDAVVLTTNPAMIDVFSGSGYPLTLSAQGGETRVRLDIARDPQRALCPVPPPRQPMPAAA